MALASSFHSLMPEISHGILGVAVLAVSAVVLLFTASVAVLALQISREWVRRLTRRQIARPQPAKPLRTALERRG